MGQKTSNHSIFYDLIAIGYTIIVSDLQPQRRKVWLDERLLSVHCPSAS